MTEETSKIRWTKVDEAPALATYSLLPIIQTYLKGSGIAVETRDISLAGRIMKIFASQLSQNVPLVRVDVLRRCWSKDQFDRTANLKPGEFILFDRKDLISLLQTKESG